MAFVEAGKHQWVSTTRLPPDLMLHVHGSTFPLHKFPMVSKSGKLAEILSETPHKEPIYLSLSDIPADAQTFELVAKFCYGYDVPITTASFLFLYTVASYLQMTDSVCHDNLLNKTMAFFHDTVIHDWNNCITVLKSCQEKEKLPYSQKPLLIPIIGECLNSIARKVSSDPSILGPPLESSVSLQLDQMVTTSRRRRLFDSDHEDLITLEIGCYELAMLLIMEHNVPVEYVAGSLFRYVRERLHVINNEEGVSIGTVNEKGCTREILETIESIIPNQTGIIPCRYLVELLRWATSFQASDECLENLQRRIGKQLEEAVPQDLLIPSCAYTQQTNYDIECVSRIFKSYSESSHGVDVEKLERVYLLIDDFLLEASKDENLNVKEFVKLMECCPYDPRRCNDGLYRAIDTFLDVHNYLTESEKEGACQMLDCRNLTPEACAHAMMNKRMPVRVLANILFVGQLHLRDAIVNSNLGDDKAQECGGSGSISSGGRSGITNGSGGSDHHDDEVRVEMERIDMKMMDLERQSCKMKREIESVGGRRERRSFWRVLIAILGCGRSVKVHDSYKNRVHPI